MSKPVIERPVYTAREIVEIMSAAKAMGFTSITVPGLSAHALDVANGPGPLPTIAAELPSSKPVTTQVRYLPPTRGNYKPARNEDEWCACGNKKVVSRFGGLYCHPCYVYKKENGR